MKKKQNVKKVIFISSAGVVLAGVIILAFLYFFYIPNVFESLERSIGRELSASTEFDFSEQKEGGNSTLTVEANHILTGREDVDIRVLESHDEDTKKISAELCGELLAEAVTDGEILALCADREDHYGYDLKEKGIFEEAFKESDIYKNMKGSFGIKEYNGNKRYLKGGCFSADAKDISELLLAVGELALVPENANKTDKLIGVIRGMGFSASTPEDVARCMEFLSERAEELDVFVELRMYFSWFSLSVVSLDVCYTAEGGERVQAETVIDLDGEDGVLFSFSAQMLKEGDSVGSISIDGGLFSVAEEDSGTVEYELSAVTVREGIFLADKDSQKELDLTLTLTLDPNENASKLVLLLNGDGKKIIKATLEGEYKDSAEEWGFSFESLVVNSIDISGALIINYSCAHSSDEVTMPEYTKVGIDNRNEADDMLSDIMKKIVGIKKYFKFLDETEN